jgi:hypothetical protein
MVDSFPERWVKKLGRKKVGKARSQSAPRTSPWPASSRPSLPKPAGDRLGSPPSSLVHPVDSTSTDFWDRAEEALCNDKDKGKIMQAYLEILGLNLTDGSGVRFADVGTSGRQEQMSALIKKKVEEMEEERWKLHWGEHEVALVNDVVNGVLLAKDIVSSAASADPHAALACAGVSVILSVGLLQFQTVLHLFSVIVYLV